MDVRGRDRRVAERAVVVHGVCLRHGVRMDLNTEVMAGIAFPPGRGVGDVTGRSRVAEVATSGRAPILPVAVIWYETGPSSLPPAEAAAAPWAVAMLQPSISTR